MASGRLLLTAALSFSACAALPPVVCAEDPSQTETEAKHAFLGEVNANSVFIRSRASEDAYATMKLNRGDKVTVVGLKGNWLKVVPPEGSFAYVPKSFVIMRGDGTVGRMNREWIAKAGSELNDLAVQPMATLHEGEDVMIIGQHNEYFKIKPPKDSYLWINKQFVDPVKVIAKADEGPQPQAQADKTEPEQPARQPKHEIAAQPDNDAAGPTSRPAEGPAVADAVEPQAPTSQPAPLNAIAEYEKLEKQFTDAGQKPILDQPLPELLAGYQKVLEMDDLPPSMQRIAELRIATIKARNDAREKFLAVRKQNDEMGQKQQALAAERQEIEDRMKQNDLQIYTALGTLRSSSLQYGQGTLYRLTDPATGRTVAYVRTNDTAKFGPFLNQFVGVRGTASSDGQLKTIIQNPTELKPVDQSKVNLSVAAQFIPPSMLKLNVVPSASGGPSGKTEPAGGSRQAKTDAEPQ